MNNTHDDTDIEAKFHESMTEPDIFTTDSELGDDQFEETVDDCIEQYKDYLYGRGQHYGPAMDGALRNAIRAVLANGRVTPTTVYGQFGEAYFEQETPDTDDLREAIEDCTADQQREMWERAQA